MVQKKASNRRQDQEIVISSGDRLTIENITDLVQRIRVGLAGASTVVIDFQPNVLMDITALQVLCSACKTASAEGKQFTYRGPLPELLLELAPLTGTITAPRGENATSCFRQFEGVQPCPS